MKRAIIFSALAFAPGCVLSGFEGDSSSQLYGADTRYNARASGSNRYLGTVGVAMEDLNGNYVSTVGSVGNFNSAGDKPVYDKRVRSYQVTHNPADHTGFDEGYSGIGQHKPPQATKNPAQTSKALLTHETRDTNKDGYVVGNWDNAACGLTTGIIQYIALPPSAWWMDTTTCIAGQAASPFFVAGSDVAGVSGAALIYLDRDKTQFGGVNGGLDRLPFATRVALLNSINTNTDLVKKGGAEIVKLNISKVTINGQSFSPAGASISLVNMGNIKIDPQNTGLRMAAAWMADRMADVLAKGQQPDISLTINGAVTLSLNEIFGNGLKFGAQAPNSLRQFAGTGGLIDSAL